jgi:hypothetical protein
MQQSSFTSCQDLQNIRRFLDTANKQVSGLEQMLSILPEEVGEKYINTTIYSLLE